MRRGCCVLVCLAVAFAAAPARAPAADVVGIADQSAAMFYSPYFKRLDVHVSRLIVSWDAVRRNTFEVPVIDEWIAAAAAAKIEPLIAFNHSRGCYDGRRIPKTYACRLPSVADYRKAFLAFRRRYPDVRVYSPWNEANHHSQPTAKRPDRAASYYNVVRKYCRGCKIVAADVLDQPKMGRYLKAFQKRAKGRPRIWGLHNYQDTNNYTTSGTREMLRSVKGDIWLTETGGIVKFGRRRFNPRRAAVATKFMFKLARSHKRVKRLYIYKWSGERRSARFDAGLVSFSGTPRPAYHVVARHLGRPGGNPEPEPVPPPPPPPSPSPEPTPAPTPAPTPEPTPTPFCIPGVTCTVGVRTEAEPLLEATSLDGVALPAGVTALTGH